MDAFSLSKKKIDPILTNTVLTIIVNVKFKASGYGLLPNF